MIKITINGSELNVEPGTTIIQACEKAGVEIPRFCYHEKLKVAGNCRMCLVEVEKMPKPVASCAMLACEGMVIHTDSKKVKQAREGVMEFLLINHPLDCPICDQGGECDLQDQAFHYGKASSRFEENKRAIADKNMGPLIKTHMTRCIHCTRCVRFANDVAGVEEIGAIGRGEDMEITTLEKAVTSELSGNVIDLCPVGALTSKPYAYKGRSWELKKTPSIDVHDAIGCHIRVDSAGNEVMRVLPIRNDEINEEWISDKTRFAYDGLSHSRLDKPYIKKNGKLTAASFQEAYEEIHKLVRNLKGNEIASIAGDLADVESMFILKNIMDQLGCQNLDAMQDGSRFLTDFRGLYLFNSSIQKIEEADLILLIGANPRKEASLVNARIRKKWLNGDIQILNIGHENNLTYPYTQISDDLKVLKEIAENSHPASKILAKAKKPMLIIGKSALCSEKYQSILHNCLAIATKFKFIQPNWNGWNILHTNASSVGALDVGFHPGKFGKNSKEIIELAKRGLIKLIFLLNADEGEFEKIKDKCKIIYIGSHGDKGASSADVVLPGLAYTEKSATYINLEGRAQITSKCVSGPGQAKDDWLIIQEIGKKIGLSSTYKNVKDLRDQIQKTFPFIKFDAKLPENQWLYQNNSKVTEVNEKIIQLENNYYLANPICRASVTMHKITGAINSND